ncbi:transcription termination factor NusA [uncultured Parolsenella sp.]|uniref:transcription termination factor NusA n=1 Tax=uncultured Parolsenella sp. TaxID=2083008 RepID=UPI0025D64A82|nr:transcription termination factor NusA [uncultured Parolsenella sp.]
MASQMMEALMALCQEKHIDELYLLDRLEQSLAASYATLMHLDWGAKVTIDRMTGKIYVYKLVPKDDSMDEEGNYTEFDEIDVTPKDTSRIAAQHAKAEINAIVRNAAREQIYEEFSQRVGDIITGTVLQSTPDFTIVKIREGVEAELPHFDRKRHPEERNERPAGERYSHNQRIKAVIIDVRDPNAQIAQPVRGEHSRPSIVISRTHPELIRRLFELEVPEIYDGVVEIRSIAREPGVRSKVAVSSLDDRLDPVGACVGPKGSRVRTVVSELRGERVDVVLWDDDPCKCVANALSPARVNRVITLEEGFVTAIVPDDQLSLAIGKEGQNARLAARLTGMHIDIKNESLAAGVLSQMPAPVEEAEDLLGDEEEGHRCEYVGPSGIQCRNMARPGSRFCGVHEKLGLVDGAEVSDDPDSLI